MNEHDIIAIEAASPRAQLLLREFAHRAGSEWSSALGEVSLAAARCGNEVARLALTNVEIRLRSYARVQNALRIPEHSARMDAYAYLGKICQAISHARLESRGIELTVSGHPFSMSSERCWLLGMIVSELVNNAARYAGTRGSASIRMELLPTPTALECRVTDDRACSPDTGPGHGFRIVEALARALRADISRQFGPGGSCAVLLCPLEA
jgi:two-component sensor histidine kinase